ncbi:MAG: putative membrane-bound dehydrogenase-like protein, partial [Verrucomicrobiales bacterium]
MKTIPLFFACLALLLPRLQAGQNEGPVRILFLGHEAAHHPSNDYYPMIAKALGREGIYFDYTTSVEEALGDYDYLSQFDGLLLYANHDTIEDHQMDNLLKYVHEGNGFIPVHCASYCFRNKRQFVKLVGGQFKHHQGKEFTTTIVKPGHPAMKGVKDFKAWDETYVHSQGADDRDILMVRKPEGNDDNIKEPEPWTWTRTHGEGRVFYTASGHDQRVWSKPEFHQLLKSGILWSIGDQRHESYDAFIAKRKPLTYEKRDNIPNYEKRPEPLQYQHPLSPEASLQYTQAPVGWKLELFAAEPQIVNPIGLAWDERGRLWAAETVDYPNEIKAERKGDDKIKILEDTNGDGRCDSVKVFADGLNIPTSLTFANGGVYVHHAAETLFLKDTNGDDKADVREVVLSGWGTGDTHAGPSNLRYGLDNRLWGTVGYSAFRDDTHQFGSGVYRFDKDGSKLEFLHQFNNNTWGLGFNNAGDVFGSTANNNPSFFCGIPATALPNGRGMSAQMIASSATFHPITPNIRQVDVFNGYTAGAGHAFANSDNFPESWRGKTAFVAGPTGNLLGKFHMSP